MATASMTISTVIGPCCRCERIEVIAAAMSSRSLTRLRLGPPRRVAGRRDQLATSFRATFTRDLRPVRPTAAVRCAKVQSGVPIGSATQSGLVRPTVCGVWSELFPRCAVRELQGPGPRRAGHVRGRRADGRPVRRRRHRTAQRAGPAHAVRGLNRPSGHSGGPSRYAEYGCTAPGNQAGQQPLSRRSLSRSNRR